MNFRPIQPPKPGDSTLERRLRMVDEQIRSRKVRDPRLLAVLENLPREIFVSEDLRALAYDDGPLDIGYAQTISQPYIVATTTESLAIESTDRVLEIGTGSGYQTAVLARLAAEVFSLERLPSLCASAGRRLHELGIENAMLECRDGWEGWPEHAPFDKIIVTAAPEMIPPLLIAQLKEQGRLVIPVGSGQGIQRLVVGVKRNGILETSDTILVRFVPFVHREDE
ncbi:MAG: protein-L-isoaspartate(D-aspartate) O-methyltransferase [Candidatus Omnitrophota bacterium]|jgi:protein-L-isoaspartate(D-aspartate) O-methyltransferase